MKTHQLHSKLVAAALLAFPVLSAFGTLPYGDPNEAYDKLPGTYVTPHFPWLNPYAGKKLNVLFIIPYMNSREVIELKQRFDVNATVIMYGGANGWWAGQLPETTLSSMVANPWDVLQNIVHERLGASQQYDAIVVAKTPWSTFPEEVRDSLLKRVSAGTPLIYIGPNNHEPAPIPPSQKWEKPDLNAVAKQYAQLFAQPEPVDAEALLAKLPMSMLPLKFVADETAFRNLPEPPKVYYMEYSQRPISLRVYKYGLGRVWALDYFDDPATSSRIDNSLTPVLHASHFVYDGGMAILAQILREATGQPQGDGKISLPAAKPAAPASSKPWSDPVPSLIVNRREMARGDMTAEVAQNGAIKSGKVSFLKADGEIDRQQIQPVQTENGVAKIALPMPELPDGDYAVVVQWLNQADKVVDFTSQSLRVASDVQIADLHTDKDLYQVGETIQGSFTLNLPLPEGCGAEAEAIDTWGRVVAKATARIQPGASTGTFALPVQQPLSRLWDIRLTLTDGRGDIVSRQLWVGMPDWNFNNFIVPTIFAPAPNSASWKGEYYTERARELGVSGANAPIIYGRKESYENFARANIVAVTYARHIGEYSFSLPTLGKEYGEFPIVKLFPMLDRMAETGKPLDPQEFPYDWKPGSINAQSLNGLIGIYQEAAKTGTPYFWLTGEEYQSGDFDGRENTSFDDETQRQFRDWCKKQYKGNLAALNQDWNTDFKDWSEVRGIMLNDAAKAKQLPRWVAFRHFMRSEVWTELFLAYSRMIQKVVGYPVRTGLNGHDHFDFTKFTDLMSSGKLYGLTGKLDAEYFHCVGPELRQSFSNDTAYLISPASLMELNDDMRTPVNQERLAWKALFGGAKGFDWEASFPSSGSLGGYSTFTPDLSEPLPFAKNIFAQVRFLQAGIGELCNVSRPLRSPVAILWDPVEHYVSRTILRQKNSFSGGPFSNVDADGGAITDALVLMKNLRIRPKFVSPQQVADGLLARDGYRAVILPYNKGMSDEVAAVLKDFVKSGGVLIADNEPGSRSRFGRSLDKGLLADMIPGFDKEGIHPFGKGVAAYLPDAINGYLGRMAKGDYSGSDAVGHVLKKYAGVRPFAELLDEQGRPRRDTLMPVWQNGSLRLLGLLRASTSDGHQTGPTTVKLPQAYHIWDVREAKYIGYQDSFTLDLTLSPKLYALLPANPQKIDLALDAVEYEPEGSVRGSVTVQFDPQHASHIDDLAQVIHVAVFAPDGRELEYYRQNVIFDGAQAAFSLPISYSEKTGTYRAKVSYPLTGLATEKTFKIGQAKMVSETKQENKK